MSKFCSGGNSWHKLRVTWQPVNLEAEMKGTINLNKTWPGSG
jgi:hypothetical protein